MIRSKTPRQPFTGKPYLPDEFKASQVEILLLLVDEVVPMDRINAWSEAERVAAGDWAFRSHLRASDNLNRVPLMPECVKRDRIDPARGADGTVMDLVPRPIGDGR